MSRMSLGAVAGVVAVGAVAGSSWLGARSWVVTGLALVAIVAMWWPSATRVSAVLASVVGLTGGTVAVTGVGRVAPGEAIPGREHAAGMTDRILGRDLPPAGVYVCIVASLVLVAGCVALAAPRPLHRARFGCRGRWIGVLGGVAASALVVASLVGAGFKVRAVADRRAEADAVTATTTRAAARIATTNGPMRPSEVAWRAGPPHPDDFWEGFERVVAVPGWDVVLTYSTRFPAEVARGANARGGTSPIVARSKRDGSELWRYWRHDGTIRGMTIDPDTGRVLVLAGGAVVVLSLEDGSEVAARYLPDDLAQGVLVGDRFIAAGFHLGAGATVGSRAVVWDFHGGGSIAVLDVVSGEVLGTTRGGVGGCAFAAAATTDSTLVVQWGQSRTCGRPRLLRLDRSDLHVTASIDGCDRCAGDRLLLAGDVIVVSLRADAPDESDIVAVSSGGTVLWRASEIAGASGVVDAVAASDLYVVARWGGAWHLVSVADGSERVRQSRCGRAFSVAADGQRVYAACDGQLVVLSVDDLNVVWDGGPSVEWDAAFAADGYLVAASWIGDRDTVVALRDR